MTIAGHAKRLVIDKYALLTCGAVQNRTAHSILGMEALSAALLENTRLVGENDAQQRRVNLEMAVIFDGAQPAELVHEKARARGGADHFHKRLL